MGLCGKTPETPDYGAAAREGVLADLETMPFEAAINAAAASGKKIVLDGKTYDFTNLGDAEVASQVARKFAEGLLQVQQKYGEDYARNAVEQLKLAQPEQSAARTDLFNRIMEQTGKPSSRPLAERWSEFALNELKGEGGLTDRELRNTQEQVRGGQVARGNFLGSAANAAEAGAVLNAGDQKRRMRQSNALQLLQSGAMPEDVQYRETQQNLANLSDFMGGRTPTAQFGQLSGAQQGASPYLSTYTAGRTDPNAGIRGASQAQQVYGMQQSFDQQQANPWMAGLSTAISSYPVWKSAFGGGNSYAPTPVYGSPAPID